MRLAKNRAVALVDLDGGRLSSLVVDGQEVLITEGEKPTRWGSFPMVPWAGRLAYGKLAFRGEDFTFPLSSPPHANHGVAHTQRWFEQGDGAIFTELLAPWPFGGRVTQRFVLGDESLEIELTVANDERAMPTLIGWHPWFRRKLGSGQEAQLMVNPGRRCELDDDLIPTGELLDVSAPPWNETFVELEADPKIVWGDRLAITISSTFDHWVIYTEPDHALCVEPQSGPPNQVNSNPHIVSPGKPLIGSMTLHWGGCESSPSMLKKGRGVQ